MTNTMTGPAGAQFPFCSSDSVNVSARVSQELDGVEDMLYMLARAHAQGKLDDNAIDDLVQECRAWLWQRSLPKFDTKRGVKSTTFIYKCATNFYRQAVRAMHRRRKSSRHRRTIIVNPDMMLQSLYARDTRLDDRISVIAVDVIDNPDKFFTEAQARVFKALIENPETPKQDLAKTLGYKRASSLSMMVRRIKERILEIDIEDHEPDTE